MSTRRQENREQRVEPEEAVGKIDLGPDAGAPKEAAGNFNQGAKARHQVEFKQKPSGGAGEVALRKKVLAEEHGGGTAADAAYGGPGGRQKQRVHDAGSHPVVGEVDGA